jgi:hypothetical protein
MGRASEEGIAMNNVAALLAFLNSPSPRWFVWSIALIIFVFQRLMIQFQRHAIESVRIFDERLTKLEAITPAKDPLDKS